MPNETARRSYERRAHHGGLMIWLEAWGRGEAILQARMEALADEWGRKGEEMIQYATQMSESAYGSALQTVARELRALTATEQGGPMGN